MTITAKVFRNLVVQGVRDANRVEPRCVHAEQCGGCAFQERSYADQVRAKIGALQQLYTPLTSAPLEVVASPDAFAYRTRMDYVATKGRFGLRMRGRFNYIVELEMCHLIAPEGFQGVYKLWQRTRELGLPDYHMRSHEGFLRYLVIRRSPQDTFLVAAVTTDQPYEHELEQVATLALEQPGVLGFHWLINDSLTDLSFGTPRQHWGSETLPMQVAHNTLHIGPNTFFQNNTHLLLPMLDAVVGAVDRTPAHVADLYGGVGTIALHMSSQAGHITCVESHTESAALAQQNIALNGASNITVVAEEVLPFLEQQQRPAHAQDSPPFEVVVVDPPRTGLGDKVCNELLRLAPRRIVYISCNPVTQLADLLHLTHTYRLTTLQGYDMFPHTPHVEMLAVLDQ